MAHVNWPCSMCGTLTNGSGPTLCPLCSPLDSEKGIRFLFEAAKASNLVLTEYHEKIAIKHGVATNGVAISRPLPTR